MATNYEFPDCSSSSESSDEETTQTFDHVTPAMFGRYDFQRKLHGFKAFGNLSGQSKSSECEPTRKRVQNLKVCKAFEKFNEKVQKIICAYTSLDPVSSRQFVKGKFDLDSSGQMMIQGAIITIMAHWEEFVVDLFREGFATFVEVGSGNPPNLDSLQKCLSSSELILKKEIRQAFQTQSPEEMMLKFLGGINSTCSGANPWVEFFASYCQNTIGGAQMVPIFSPGATNSIDALFARLFKITGERSLTDQLLRIGRFRYKIRLNKEVEIELQISSVSALKNISRLYYALRCVFAHGHNQKTLSGALKDFPRNVAEFDLGNEKAAKYYLGLYRRIEKYGRETSVSYLTFINMIEFLKRAAFFLMRTLAKWVYDATGGQGCIWGYKPHS